MIESHQTPSTIAVRAAFKRPRHSFPLRDHGELIYWASQWELKFDGNDNDGLRTIHFLDSVTDLMHYYSVPAYQIIRIVPIFLEGFALAWFQSFNGSIATWDSFVNEFSEAFVPNDFLKNISNKVMNCHQDNFMHFEDFLHEIDSLLRFFYKMSRSEKLTCIYQKMSLSIRQKVSRDDFSSTSSLLEIVDKIEKHTLETESSNTKATEIFTELSVTDDRIDSASVHKQLLNRHENTEPEIRKANVLRNMLSRKEQTISRNLTPKYDLNVDREPVFVPKPPSMKLNTEDIKDDYHPFWQRSVRTAIIESIIPSFPIPINVRAVPKPLEPDKTSNKLYDSRESC